LLVSAPEVLSVAPEETVTEPPLVSVRAPVTVRVPAVTFSAPELVAPQRRSTGCS
jgi:hypothetical protein